MTTQNNPTEHGLGQLSQQEIHHLITVSTGVVDLFMIDVQMDAPLLLPQNIVISVFDAPTGQSHLTWKNQNLAVWAVHSSSVKQALALVIEGEQESQRFILLCDQMPEATRWRISEVVDEDTAVSDPLVFKYVKRGEQRYIVPNLQVLEQRLGLV